MKISTPVGEAILYQMGHVLYHQKNLKMHFYWYKKPHNPKNNYIGRLQSLRVFLDCSGFGRFGNLSDLGGLNGVIGLMGLKCLMSSTNSNM